MLEKYFITQQDGFQFKVKIVNLIISYIVFEALKIMLQHGIRNRIV